MSATPLTWMATMPDGLRQRYAQAIQACGPLSVTKVLYAVMAVRDDELERLRGIIDRHDHGIMPVCEGYMAARAEQAERERAEWRERAEKAEAARTMTRERLDALITAGFGATTDTLRGLRAALDDIQEPRRGER